ncbi:hypothetical protein HF1_08370 [Mycoplasma haemofelis str. Langford 1]|uniref:Uncharacterized protein n=1 Tax=Mycoplasma haemofelis (strain Langford 1) TaxID=941640 RepID=E8ZI74_MYCHL|nr:hypothetical protein [Mycoplasma haemofelis]CBY92845.1 hypothetical protein HF1_08370 [Mycoplasma haemofelis str. Langford 1]
MNVFRALLGVGALGATAAGVFFGLGVKEKDDKYSIQMTKYRNVATKTRSSISSNNAINNIQLVVMDPESEKWDTWWKGLTTYKREHVSKIVPSDVVDGNWTKFRDWCFGKMEERQDDLKSVDIFTYFSDTSTGTDEKLLWPLCVPTAYEIK